MTEDGSQQRATLYDVSASAPVGRCSAQKRCLYLRNVASSGWRFLLTIYFHYSLFNVSVVGPDVVYNSSSSSSCNNNNNNKLFYQHNNNDNHLLEYACQRRLNEQEQKVR